jgi:ABC-type transport system involved in multi-copper enzyme maturation permease subunit
MRAFELMRETFTRKSYIWVVHLVWLALYGGYWWLFVPTGQEFGGFVFIWSGFFLPLALSAGIFGDDIASGRICVLVTRPFWLGQLYIYRLLGLSLQAAVHLVLAGALALGLHAALRRGDTQGLVQWLFATWLLYNACAGLSTSLSVVVGRAFNSLLLLLLVVTGYFLLGLLVSHLRDQSASTALVNIIRYSLPPFELLSKLAGGEYGKYSLTVGRFSVAKSVACVAHTVILTAAYAAVGVILLSRREFSRTRD